MQKNKKEETSKEKTQQDSPIVGTPVEETTVPESINQTGTVPITETKPKEEEKVTVPKSMLEEILEGVKSKDDTIKKMNEKIEMLTEVADKNRVFKWEEEHKGKLIRKAKVATWLNKTEENPNGEEKIIVGWKMIQDEVGVVDGRLIEKQIIKIFMFEGINELGKMNEPSTVEVKYLDFSRNIGRKWGEIIKESKTEDGEFRTLKFEDGLELELNITFLNL